MDQSGFCYKVEGGGVFVKVHDSFSSWTFCLFVVVF